MKTYAQAGWFIGLWLVLGLGVCRSAPGAAGPAPAGPPSAMGALPAAPGEPELWKIPPRPASETAELGPLEEVNQFFRATYAAERARAQRSQTTVILFRPGGASLFRDGRLVETARVIPAEYLNLRYAAHVPLMLFLKLHPLCGAPFDAPARADLRKCLDLLRQAHPALAHTGLSELQLRRQHRILSDAIAFLSRTLDAGQVESDQLLRYARAASVDIEENMREAGAAQVDGLHEQLLKWRKQIPDAEWRKARFIMRGGQQPRGGSAVTLYLSALLKDPGDGRGYVGESTRFVYREDTSLPATGSAPANPWDADLQLLAAVDLDAVASDALFSDPDRLAIDIVSDGARAKIRQLDLSPLQPTGE